MSADHKWIPSTLGHGDQMCAWCSITVREAAALGELGERPKAPLPSPDWAVLGPELVEALVKALTPFAAVADEYDDREEDSYEVWRDAGPEQLIRESFRLELYRKARSALSAIGEAG